MPYKNTAGAKSTTGATPSNYNTRAKAQAAEDIYATDLEEVLVNITEQLQDDDQTEIADIVNITVENTVTSNQFNLQDIQEAEEELEVEPEAKPEIPIVLTNHSKRVMSHIILAHFHDETSQFLPFDGPSSGAQNISEQTIVGLCKNGLNPDIKPFVVGKDPKTINELREAIYLATSVAECKTSDVITNNTNISTQNVQKLNLESVNNVQSMNDLCSSLVEGIRSVFKEEVMAVGVPHGQNKPNYSQNYRGPRQQSLTKCKFCGKSHVFDRRKCPAYNVECFYCHKFGHFKEVCDKKEFDEQRAKSQNWQPTEQSYRSEPLHTLPSQSLAGAKSIVQLDDTDNSNMRVMNPIEKTIHLPANFVVASISAVDSKSIISLTDTQVDKKTQNSKSDDPCDILDFDFSDSDLSEDQKTILQAFLSKNRQVFAKDLS
ncbi:unnamed protein product [Mytilus coruscus]|uniref:CCHC-type domain-containing protein n=1 Tax=Mytilus coruscus TaxID=42192 RepID=A0A6J8C0S3_MYTCO|nr:unnamed protein product [Mytilus coruscus]